MKKLLFILPDLKIGGTLSSFLNLYEELEKEGYDISIFTLSSTGRNDWPFMKHSLPISRIVSYFNTLYTDQSGLDKILAFPCKVALKLMNAAHINWRKYLYGPKVHQLDQGQYDTVIAFQEDEPTYFASYFHSVRKVAWIHCSYNYRQLDISRSELSYYKQFDTIVSVSRTTSDEFVAAYPCLKDKATYLYNLQNNRQIQNLAQELPCKEFVKGTYTLVSVGRLSAVKRFSHIPAIAKSLIQRGLDFKWYIIGPISAFEKEEEMLIRRNITNDISNHVILLGSRPNPYPYIKNADLLVCLSESEACPMVFGEAKALCTPIVSTDFDSAHEFLGEDTFGVISTLDNMADTIFGLLNDTTLYEQIKNNMLHPSDERTTIVDRLHKIL